MLAPTRTTTCERQHAHVPGELALLWLRLVRAVCLWLLSACVLALYVSFDVLADWLVGFTVSNCRFSMLTNLRPT